MVFVRLTKVGLTETKPKNEFLLKWKWKIEPNFQVGFGSNRIINFDSSQMINQTVSIPICKYKSKFINSSLFQFKVYLVPSKNIKINKLVQNLKNVQLK